MLIFFSLKLQCNRLMRWCSAPNCTNAVKVTHVEPRPVTCRCGHKFCFGCSENWHDPVRCHLIKKWIKKCDDDSETSNWISANTKECPTCNATIEKDGGCNHMICKNQACKADFCWVCLGKNPFFTWDMPPKLKLNSFLAITKKTLLKIHFSKYVNIN